MEKLSGKKVIPEGKCRLKKVIIHFVLSVQLTRKSVSILRKQFYEAISSLTITLECLLRFWLRNKTGQMFRVKFRWISYL